MRRNIDGTCSPSCCSNPNIRTINTMGADTQGNFTIRGDQGIHVTVGTNEIIISGIAVYYDNLDGNLVIDNDAMTIDLANDISIAGDMIIAGDLTVNGTYYTVHAEHVYTEDDYIIMRDGAVTGLGAGDYSGFQVKLYDGVNDGRLVIDNSGTARVGDVGDEQPLLTRAESGSLTNGNLLQWDGTNQKAIDSGKSINSFGIPNSASINNYGPIVVAAGTQTDLSSYTIPANGTYLIIGVISSTTVMNTGARFSGFTINGSVNWMDVFGAVAGQGVNGTFATVNTLSAGDVLKEIIYTTVENIQASGRFIVVRLI